MIVGSSSQYTCEVGMASLFCLWESREAKGFVQSAHLWSVAGPAGDTEPVPGQLHEAALCDLLVNDGSQHYLYHFCQPLWLK